MINLSPINHRKIFSKYRKCVICASPEGTPRSMCRNFSRVAPLGISHRDLKLSSDIDLITHSPCFSPSYLILSISNDSRQINESVKLLRDVKTEQMIFQVHLSNVLRRRKNVYFFLSL